MNYNQIMAERFETFLLCLQRGDLIHAAMTEALLTTKEYVRLMRCETRQMRVKRCQFIGKAVRNRKLRASDGKSHPARV